MGSIFLLAEPSLSPGNRAEGRRSEWETRLFVEEPMLSTGLHFALESTGGGAGVAIGPRAHHALPARHRQDDRDRNRGGRPDPQGRAGAFGLARDPRALSKHSGPASPHGYAGGARADRRRSDAAGRGNPHSVGKSRKIIKFKRQ